MSFEDEVPGPRYVSVRQLSALPQYKGLFSESAIRHLIFAAGPTTNSAGDIMPGNGLDRALLRFGRKVVIDVLEFEKWVEMHRTLTLTDRSEM